MIQVSRNVFIYWIGEEYSLIKLLRKLMIKYQESGEGYTLHHITPENINNYLDDIPDYFFDLLPAHQADYLRIYCLYKYGGIWLDSDIIMMNNLDYYFDLLKRYDGFLQLHHQISISFIGSNKNNPLMLEWLNNAKSILDNKKKNIHWTEIGTTLIESMKYKNSNLFSKTHFINAFNETYPVTWDKCLSEFVEKPYDNYKNLITKNRQDIVIIVNSVYKHLKDWNELDILNSDLPISYFLRLSFSS